MATTPLRTTSTLGHSASVFVPPLLRRAGLRRTSRRSRGYSRGVASRSERFTLNLSTPEPLNP